MTRPILKSTNFTVMDSLKHNERTVKTPESKVAKTQSNYHIHAINIKVQKNLLYSKIKKQNPL